MRALVLPFLLTVACSQPATPQGTQPQADGKTEAAAAPKADPPAVAPPIAADAQAAVGSAAPDFTLTDVAGKTHTLAEYRGKTVVLEWFNPHCPFVNHAHTEGSLVSMAKEQTGKGIVWLAINSGAPGKQGHGVQANEEGAAKYKLDHPILLDETGAVGHAYGAQKTPHVYLIDAEGTLVYRGAIDNAPFGEVNGEGAKINYLASALAQIAEGNAVATAQTPPYGCTVKY